MSTLLGGSIQFVQLIRQTGGDVRQYEKQQEVLMMAAQEKIDIRECCTGFVA
jgi:hypothetical protein